MRSIILILAFVGLSLTGFSQKTKDNKFLIVSYNIENLFDTINNPHKNDDEFLPEGKKKWDSKKYYEKLANLAYAIQQVNTEHRPDVIGFMEVENIDVLKQLASEIYKDTKIHYQCILEEGPDPRGIDNGFVYNSETFQYLGHQIIPIKTKDNNSHSRPILYIKGIAYGDTLHLFVNHWKSRIGKNTEPQRVDAAVCLKAVSDSILKANARAKIVMMGDFNDEPTNKSILQVLLAGNKRKNIDTFDLYNLMYDKHNINNTGTLTYRGNWQMFDQLIVSYEVLQDMAGLHATYESGQVLQKDFLLQKDKKTKEANPKSSYEKGQYQSGYSDHLPVYLMLTK